MVSIIIPTYNCAGQVESIFSKLKECPAVNEVVVVDSGSTDDSIRILESYGAVIVTIEKSSFDHGRSRVLGGKKAGGDILVYMTQDALLVNEHSIENLIKPLLEDKEIGASYGRQLPHPDATPFAAHLRAFNYPPKSSIKSLKERGPVGIRAPFISNSFAAYKKSALEEVGWFKEGIILSEDVYAGAKLLMAGYKIAYRAEALVNHSHNYSVLEEFKRYFDIGVFHRMESWILDEFGKAEEEGFNYLKSEWSYLSIRRRYDLIPEFLLRIVLKYMAYKAGNNYKRLPAWLIKKLSMHADFWDK